MRAACLAVVLVLVLALASAVSVDVGKEALRTEIRRLAREEAQLQQAIHLKAAEVERLKLGSFIQEDVSSLSDPAAYPRVTHTHQVRHAQHQVGHAERALRHSRVVAPKIEAATKKAVSILKHKINTASKTYEELMQALRTKAEFQKMLNPAMKLKKAQAEMTAAKQGVTEARLMVKRQEEVVRDKMAQKAVQDNRVNVENRKVYHARVSLQVAIHVAKEVRSKQLSTESHLHNNKKKLSHDETTLKKQQGNEKRHYQGMQVDHTAGCSRLKRFHAASLEGYAKSEGFPSALARCHDLMHQQKLACGNTPTPWVKEKMGWKAAKAAIVVAKSSIATDKAKINTFKGMLPSKTAEATKANAARDAIKALYQRTNSQLKIVNIQAKPVRDAAAAAARTLHQLRQRLGQRNARYQHTLRNEKAIAIQTAKERKAKHEEAMRKAQEDAKERGVKAHIAQLATNYEKAKAAVAEKAETAADAAAQAAAATQKLAANPGDDAVLKAKNRAESTAETDAKAATDAQKKAQAAKIALEEAKKKAPAAALDNAADQEAAENKNAKDAKNQARDDKAVADQTAAEKAKKDKENTATSKKLSSNLESLKSKVANEKNPQAKAAVRAELDAVKKVKALHDKATAADKKAADKKP